MLKSFFQKNTLEAGCDEAGRGCLAGPVVAAAVILPRVIPAELKAINDSKKISEKQRYALRPWIEKFAQAYAIGIVSNQEIDKINILNASFLAMHRAINQLTTKPELLLIDGNRFKPYQDIKHTCIVKGDGKYLAIAAASILAKTYRDDIMDKLHAAYPDYQWQKNKGYPTQLHRDTIAAIGTSPHHRLSFDWSGEKKLNKKKSVKKIVVTNSTLF